MFVYGQTGSGKTYTMEGVRGDPQKEGIIPRMVSEMYDRMADIQENSAQIEFTVQISFVEIYNEKIRDLLNPIEKDLKLRDHNTKRGIYIEGVKCPFAGNTDDCLEIIDAGHVNRAVAPTIANAESSRSHAVFMFFVTATNTGL